TTQLTGSHILGSPAYMSPEHFTGKGLTGRCDQYSLAVVAFEALSGRLPFDGDTWQMMYRHAHEPPPPIHEINGTLPPALSAVLQKAMAKQPEERFATTAEFVAALEVAIPARTTSGRAAHPERPAAAAEPPGQAGAGREVEALYQRGLEAYRRGDYQVAITYFNNVIARTPERHSAILMRREAAQRLAEIAGDQPVVAPPVPTSPPRQGEASHRVVPGAGGHVAARPARAYGKTLLAVLAAVILVLLAVPLTTWLLSRLEEMASAPPPTPSTTVEAVTTTMTPAARATTPLPPDSAFIVVASPGDGSRWAAGDEEGSLSASSRLPLDRGPLTIAIGAGPAELDLPEGVRLFLGDDTTVEITSSATGQQSDPPRIVIWGGRLVLATSNPGAIVANPFGAEGGLEATGLLGVAYSAEPFRFEADCLIGRCRLKGDLSDEPLELAEGQAGRVGGSGRPEAPFPARYELYHALASSLVPSATATPTPSPTPTPTNTPRPTSTFTPRPLPTWTSTPVSVPTSTPPPTSPPSPPTNPPPPPSTEPPPPPPPSPPTEPPPPTRTSPAAITPTPAPP
ncbi:MAG: hypothetical protein L0332_35710, partial [Chloroflexi bacterium]|nr:hypothetical protein [Chloroflexota bacterium]